MLYSHYLLSREEEELLPGIRAFPDLFSSLYVYLEIVDEFAALKRTPSQAKKGRLTKILSALNELQQDEEVILQSRLAGCEHDARFRHLEREGVLMHHIQQLQRNVHEYARARNIALSYSPEQNFSRR